MDIIFRYEPKWDSTIRIKGIPNENGDNFVVSLHSSSKVMLRIEVDYADNKVEFNARDDNNSWQKAEVHNNNDIRANEPFLLEITCGRKEYTVKINTVWRRSFKHKYDYMLVKTLHLEGSMLPIEVNPESTRCPKVTSMN